MIGKSSFEFFSKEELPNHLQQMLLYLSGKNEKGDDYFEFKFIDKQGKNNRLVKQTGGPAPAWLASRQSSKFRRIVIFEPDLPEAAGLRSTVPEALERPKRQALGASIVPAAWLDKVSGGQLINMRSQPYIKNTLWPLLRIGQTGRQQRLR